MTQMGSSPFPVSFSAPFFFHSFFFHSCYWKTNYLKKKMLLYILSFSNNQNKFIEIYFIHFFSFNYGPFCPNFFEHIRLHFLDPSVQHFLLCYSPSIPIIHTTHNNPCYTHHSHINHQIAQGMCDLTRAHQVLGNRIPNLLTLSSRYL